jgi:hypothetical protein
MNHKRVSIEHGLAGCRICAAVLLDRRDLKEIIVLRLREVLGE